MKTLIIDDEISARHTLKKFLSKYCPTIEIIGEADGLKDAKKSIYTKQPDLLFLDIAMQDAIGLDLINQFTDPPFQVIFTTSFDNHTIKALDYNAIDYLLKPLHPHQLVRVVQKAKEKVKQQDLVQRLVQVLQQNSAPKEAKRISLSTQEGAVILELEEICHLQSEGSYTTLFYGNGEKIIVSKLLKDFERVLPQPPFFRMHQSHIINIHSIRKILKEDGGMVLLKSGKKIPVSRRKKQTLQQLISKELIVI